MKQIIFKHRRLTRFERMSEPKRPSDVTFEDTQHEAKREEIHLETNVPMDQPGGEENLEAIEQKEFKY